MFVLVYAPAALACGLLIWIAARTRERRGLAALCGGLIWLVLVALIPPSGAGLRIFLLAAACGAAVAGLRAAGVAAGKASLMAGGVFAIGCAVDAGFYYGSTHRPWARQMVEWRNAYPAVPRSERLPNTEPVVEQAALHAGDSRWEEHFEDDSSHWGYSDRPGARYRAHMGELHKVHTDFADRFARRMQFGPIRVSRMTYDLMQFDDLPAEPPSVRIQQPRGGLSRAPSDDAAPLNDDLHSAVAAWHLERGIDFANEAGFGAFGRPSDEYDAPLPADYEGGEGPFLIGFRSHAAQTDPGDGPLPGWALTGFELIGLVLHDRPVAYQSDYLPIAGPDAPIAGVRDLTPFESAALGRLATGEWVVGEAESDRLRAVGALTAAKACADCHGVSEGRLLGALSYEFVRNATTSE